MSWRCARLGFFGSRLVGLVLDGSHHGKGEHDERDVTMPAVPGSGFVVVEPELGARHILRSTMPATSSSALFPLKWALKFVLHGPGGLADLRALSTAYDSRLQTRRIWAPYIC